MKQLLFLLLLFAVACTSEKKPDRRVKMLASAPVKEVYDSLTHDFIKSAYFKQLGWEYRPEGSSVGKPVFVWFPGRGEAPRYIRDSLNRPGIKNTNLVQQIIAGWRPEFSIMSFTGNGSGVYVGTSSSGGDSAFFWRIYLYLRDTMRVDTNRIYIGGYSGGGSASFKWVSLSEKHASKVAAFLPVSPMQDWEYLADVNFPKYGRILNSWGTAGTGTGDLAFYNRLKEYSDLIVANGGYARYDAVAGAGHSGTVWNPFFDKGSAVWPWLLTKSRNPGVVPVFEIARYELIYMSDSSVTIKKISGQDMDVKL